MENGTSDTNQVEDQEVGIPNTPNQVIDINAIRIDRFIEVELYRNLNHKMPNSQIKNSAISRIHIERGKN